MAGPVLLHLPSRKLIDPENLQHILWHNRSAPAPVKTGHLRLLEPWRLRGMSMAAGPRQTNQPGQAGGRGVPPARAEVAVITHQSPSQIFSTRSRSLGCSAGAILRGQEGDGARSDQGPQVRPDGCRSQPGCSCLHRSPVKERWMADKRQP